MAEISMKYPYIDCAKKQNKYREGAFFIFIKIS